jgi:hypothetical protein
MKKFYTNSILFVSSLVFSKMKDFRSFFVFGNSSKKIVFAFLFLFFFAENASAQCTITPTTNASTLTCNNNSPSSLLSTCGGIIYIGNGTTAMSLIMNTNLDLTCLGAIRFVVRKYATLDFSGNGNNPNLQLAAGSSIEFETGSALYGGPSNNCSGSDLILIGTIKVAACEGGSSITNFKDLVINGGYNNLKVTPESASSCGPGSFTFTATSGPQLKATFYWYTSAIGGAAIQSGIDPTSSTSTNISTYKTGVINETRTYYVEAIYEGSTTPTARKAVTATVNARPTSVVSGTTTTCNGIAKTISVALTGTGPWNLTCFDGTTSTPITAIATSPYTFNVTPTSTKTYTVTALSDFNCTAIAANMTGSAEITVNPVPNNVSNGFTGGTICNGSTGILKFDADDTGFAGPYTIVYTDGTTNWPANIQSASLTPFNVAVNPIITTNYRLISITNAVGCIRTAGFGNETAIIVVNQTPTLTGAVQAASVCVGSGATINLTGLLASRTSTITYTINGVAQTAVTGVVANASGVGSFTSAVLTTANNGQILQITGVTTTNSTTNCSATFTRDVTMSVNPTPTLTGASQAASVCVGSGALINLMGLLVSSTSTISYSINGVSQTPVTAVVANALGVGSFTSSALTAANNNQILQIIGVTTTNPNTNCSATLAQDVNMSVNPLPTAPILGTVTQPYCTILGTVELSGLPAGIWTLYQDGIAIVSAGTGVKYTVTGISPGPHYFTVKSGGCTSVNSVVVIIDAVPAITTTTWKGILGWDNGAPSVNKKIIFDAPYNSIGILEGCSCQVNTGVNVVFESVDPSSGHTLKITNQVEVLGTGTLTFENNASLVQINDAAVNAGAITYQRTTTPILDTDYVYWSSPVTGAKLGAIQTGTLYYSFNAAGNSWTKAYASTPMLNGIGYIVRGAGTSLASGPRLARTATFIGVPNNGINDVNITASKSNLIGNPYPSAIDPDAFLEANKAALEGTLYFWTHKSEIKLAGSITVGTAGSGAYAYTSGDYAAYTLIGGVGTSLTEVDAFSKIAAGQSFMALGSSQGGTARFTNSMRLTKAGEILDNSQFLRPASGSKISKVTTTNEIEKSRIWLNLSNTQGAYKQTLIGYVTGATNHYDRGFDAVSINGNAYVDFYSINNDSLLTIQARPLPIPEADTVPLGFSSAIEGDFTISINKTDGLLTAMDVFLEDKLSKTFTNLKISTYTFSSGKGTFNDRFVMRYTDKTLEVTDFETTLENQVVVSNKNKHLIIASTDDAIDKVVIFDTTARKVYEKKNVDSHELRILDLMSSRQILLVKVVLQNGKSITKKLMY